MYHTIRNVGVWGSREARTRDIDLLTSTVFQALLGKYLILLPHLIFTAAL